MRASAITRTNSKMSIGWLFSKGVPGMGLQAIDGNAFRLRIKGAEGFEHAKAVLHTLAQAEYASAAERHLSSLDSLDGIESVLKGVGGYDVRVKLRRGVDVVIVGGDSGFLELAGLPLVPARLRSRTLPCRAC